jgi:poly-gamma-glutamate synthesis protein (capsule biosynthesis protein)
MADYQFEVCHAAVDAGADLILGTHPHVLKAIETYKGKVIFHSLANFGFDKPRDPKTGEMRSMAASAHFKEQLERYGVRVENMDKAQDVFGAWSDEALQTGIAKIVIANKKIEKVSFLPVLFDRDEKPAQVLKGSEAGFKKVVDYIKDITREAGVQTDFKVEGDELVIQQ